MTKPISDWVSPSPSPKRRRLTPPKGTVLLIGKQSAVVSESPFVQLALGNAEIVAAKAMPKKKAVPVVPVPAPVPCVDLARQRVMTPTKVANGPCPPTARPPVHLLVPTPPPPPPLRSWYWVCWYCNNVNYSASRDCYAPCACTARWTDFSEM